MFALKEHHLDQINGFAFALLVAMPVIRTDIISLPTPALILPAFILFSTAGLQLFKSGSKKFQVNAIAYYYLIILQI